MVSYHHTVLRYPCALWPPDLVVVQQCQVWAPARALLAPLSHSLSPVSSVLASTLVSLAVLVVLVLVASLVVLLSPRTRSVVLVGTS